MFKILTLTNEVGTFEQLASQEVNRGIHHFSHFFSKTEIVGTRPNHPGSNMYPQSMCNQN